LNALEEHDESVEPFEELIEFNSYAVQYRYGAYPELGDSLDRPSVVERVGKLLRMVWSKADASAI